MKLKTALLEIGCEELPVDYIAPALAQIREKSGALLQAARLSCESITAEATPRRLVLFLTGLDPRQEDRVEEVAGPTRAVALDAQGNLTPAGLGFLRKHGLTEAGPMKNDRLWVQVREEGKKTEEILPELFFQVIKSISFPKTMRWESSQFRFARPIRWLVALCDDRVLPVQAAGIESGRETRLHPFAEAFSARVNRAEDLSGVLARGQVILEFEQRREKIRAQLASEARESGGRLVEDDELLERVAWMTESPRVVRGRMDEAFLALPREVVTTAMREHQRYFAVESEADRSLLPWFLAVADNPACAPESIRPGCEQVLTSRLQDAKFFYQEDLKRPLEERVGELDRVLWIKGLGSLGDKTARLEALAGFLAERLDPGFVNEARQAAHLSKADLVTLMIQEKEFNSLQGIMGGVYAGKQGIAEKISRGIGEHYFPRAAGDPIPGSATGRILALTDRFDSLIGCWGAGFIPTGTKDPYALRRAAQGIVGITCQGNLQYSLTPVLDAAVHLFPQFQDRAGRLVSEARQFILGRMETFLAARHVAPDMAQAVLASPSDDLLAVFRKAMALNALKDNPEFQSAIVAFSRVKNILPDEWLQKSISDQPLPEAEEALFQEGIEKELYEACLGTRAKFTDLVGGHRFDEAFWKLAGLQSVIDRWFNEVRVLDADEKIRHNRLSILAHINRLVFSLADFSKLVGPT